MAVRVNCLLTCEKNGLREIKTFSRQFIIHKHNSIETNEDALGDKCIFHSVCKLKSSVIYTYEKNSKRSELLSATRGMVFIFIN